MITTYKFDKLGFETLQIECEDPDLGLLKQLPDYGFGVIGTREPQLKSFALLEKMIEDLKRSDLVIVSGFARGVDSKAHELALDHGLKTIAILGCGLNIDYPTENRYLRRRIVENGGMIISPFRADDRPIPRNFLNRNQLIAHFSKAVWVVEAAAISGTLNTAKHASEMNRDLYATPCFPDDPFYEGNQKLLSQKKPDRYPFAIPLFGVHTLSNTWPHLEPGKSRNQINRKNLSQIQRWVYDLVGHADSCHVQVLLNKAIDQGISPGQFYADFIEELKQGRLKEDPHGGVSLS